MTSNQKITYCGIDLVHDDAFDDTPQTYLISNTAAKNIEAFTAKHGRMPCGVVETMAAMLHGADTDVDS